MEDDPPYDISIAREDGHNLVSDDCLVGAVRAALQRHQVRRADISLALVGDRRIAALNERHLQHDGPTDVLTFDLRDAPAGKAPADVIEGEIVVSTDTAVREAERLGHDVEAELSLYAIHGILHLLGYDDQTEKQAADMHRMENDILVSLGYDRVFDRLSS